MLNSEVEIARLEGATPRSVRLELQADGGIRLHTYDMGPTSPSADGRERYELWVTVPRREIGKLAFLLLRERFAGRLQAVTEFRDYCKGNEIVNEFGASP